MYQYNKVLVLVDSDLHKGRDGNTLYDFNISSDLIDTSDLIMYKNVRFKDKYRKL